MTISHKTKDAPLSRRLVAFARRAGSGLPDWAVSRSHEAVALNVRYQLAALCLMLKPSR